MSDEKPRPPRQQFTSRVRLSVGGKGEIAERYALNLSNGGLFVRDDLPPAPGSIVLVEFVLPDGSPLSRVVAKVVHARPATTPGERNAGMGLQFLEMDAVATEVVAKLSKEGKAPVRTSPPPVHGAPKLDSIGPVARAPLVRMDGPVVGIDLGTVNSCVAVAKEGRARVIRSSRGYETVPSVVYVAADDSVLVGHQAVERMILEPERAVHGSKRFLGRQYASREVQMLGHFFGYELVEGPDGRAAAGVAGKVLRLEVVAAHILRVLREMAEHHLQQEVRRAVITVPAYFDETQRQAVREAGRLAGLHIERILNEPTAAAVAFGYGKGLKRTALVYDLGGGTFDATLLRIEGDRLEVLATFGDPFLGGSDFDDRLTEYVLMAFERDKQVNLRTNRVAVQRIRFAVELAKRQLSEIESTNVDLPFIVTGEGGKHLDLRMTLTRQLLESLTEDLVDRTLTIVQSVLDAAGVTSDALDDVLLVGGQSRMPAVRRRVAERFGKQPSKNVHPDEAVALGAALVAETYVAKSPLDLLDILPAAIRLGKPDGKTQVLLRRGTRLPAETWFEITPDKGSRSDYRAMLYRGEKELAADNTFLGTLRMPADPQLAAAGTRARATLRVSADGLLSATIEHPLTGEAQSVEVSLVEPV